MQVPLPVAKGHGVSSFIDLKIPTLGFAECPGRSGKQLQFVSTKYSWKALRVSTAEPSTDLGSSYKFPKVSQKISYFPSGP